MAAPRRNKRGVEYPAQSVYARWGVDALQRAIDLAGSQAELADMLGVVAMAVSNWKRRGVPVAQAIAIEKALRGSVTREELRPDVFVKTVGRSRKPRKKAA